MKKRIRVLLITLLLCCVGFVAYAVSVNILRETTVRILSGKTLWQRTPLAIEAASIPRAWGGLVAVTAQSVRGEPSQLMYFQAEDGTIRIVVAQTVDTISKIVFTIPRD